MKVTRDLVAGGAISTLNGAQPVSGTLLGRLSGFARPGSATFIPLPWFPVTACSTFSRDGGLLAAGPTIGTVTLRWGYAPVPGAYAQQASNFTTAAVHMPGSFLRGDQNTTSSDHGPATILFSGINATNLAQIERPLTAGYQDGFADYAGLEFPVRHGRRAHG